ncbi:hypothetical protein H3C61_01410 [Candidatus Gracilibacteria bacterium]|nr:hypothetical protein [Candidatus Gracilibacteria bacterium]
MKKNIGKLLIEEGFIDQESLENALNSQVEFERVGIKLRIGEILVRNGKIENRKVLFNFLVKHGIKLMIGETLLLLEYINLDQYRQIRNIDIVNKNKKIDKGFGEIAVDLGFITQEKFLEFLENTNRKLRVGEQLVRDKILTKESLNLVLEDQKNNPIYKDKKLLDILLETKMISKEIYNKYSGKIWDINNIDFKLEDY